MEKYVNVIDTFLAKNLSSNAATLTNNNKIPSFVSQTSMSDDVLKKLYKPIIYVSMGTVFNNENSDLFQVLVEACKFFAHKYAVIVSTGDEKAYEKYANSPLNSDSILLVPHTPQVEILKIAHLFITHAGMNSVSEAIQYGVPIICLPLSGDQPFVAWRVADELGMGIRLQPDATLTVDKVKESISEILTNPSYKQQATHLSKISQTYTGHVTACDLTVNFIQENDELNLNMSNSDLINSSKSNSHNASTHDIDSNMDTVSKARLIASRRLRTKAKKASRSFKSLFKYERE
jgi:UDP:flavonoid glycosyltransferase YjiC (YdhE family)